MKIARLFKRLLPTGRAFNVPAGGVFDAVVRGCAETFEDLYSDARSVFDQLLPDSNNFTVQDAEDWERRLGIVVESGATLAERKTRILRKQAYPANANPSGSYRWLQKQLRDAGFDVYVHENRFLYDTDFMYLGGSNAWFGYQGAVFGTGTKYTAVDPRTYVNLSPLNPTFGNNFIFGSSYFGNPDAQGELIANHIEAERDLEDYNNGDFDFTNNSWMWRNTFLIAGQSLPDLAQVPLSQKKTFRQIIMSIKPAQTAGVLLVEYTS